MNAQTDFTIRCGEIWGGNHNVDAQVSTSAINASLYSSSFSTTDDKIPGAEAGGDIYYLSVCNGDLLTRIAVADVVGHGQQVTETSQNLFQSLKTYMDSLGGNQVLADLNRDALAKGVSALTTAMILGVYRESSEIMFSYAGHHPVLLRSANDKVWRPLELAEEKNSSALPANLPLGVEGETIFEQSTVRVSIGDCLFAYTDGLTDARNSAGESFGSQRLENVLASVENQPEPMKQAVLTELRAFCGDTARNDDITFLCVGFK